MHHGALLTKPLSTHPVTPGLSHMLRVPQILLGTGNRNAPHCTGSLNNKRYTANTCNSHAPHLHCRPVPPTIPRKADHGDALHLYWCSVPQTMPAHAGARISLHLYCWSRCQLCQLCEQQLERACLRPRSTTDLHGPLTPRCLHTCTQQRQTMGMP